MVYCYSTRDGSIRIERCYPMGKAPRKIRVTFHLDPSAALAAVAPPANYPCESFSLGVNPRQADAAERKMAMLGCPTRFNRKTGDAILDSRDHRNRFLKATGRLDLDAGYGDWAGNH